MPLTVRFKGSEYLNTAHVLYQRRDIGPAERQVAYRGLFKEATGGNNLQALRKCCE